MEDTQLIQQLLECSLACENCAASCLNEENVEDMKNCIILDRDCADICLQAARLLQRNSVIGRQFLLICEEICRLCAGECGKHPSGHCQQCANSCRSCAEACHEYHEPISQL